MQLKTNIVDYIETLVDEFNDDGYKTNLQKICEHLKIPVINAKFKDLGVSGAIIKTNDNWKIYVAEDESFRRKRFTTAHELGHYISHMFDSYSFKILEENGQHKDYAVYARNNKNNAMEKEANAIAAELLMPASHVIRLLKQGLDVAKMAKVFEVSESAMTFRLLNMNYVLMEQY